MTTEKKGPLGVVADVEAIVDRDSRVVVQTEDPNEMVKQIWDVLLDQQEASERPILLRSGSDLYQPRPGDRGARRVSASGVKMFLGEHFKTEKAVYSKRGELLSLEEKPFIAPSHVYAEVRSEVPEKFWPFNGVTRIPLLVRENANDAQSPVRLMRTPGYDRGTGLCFDPPELVEKMLAEQLPEKGFENARAAWSYLRHEWMHDFVFMGPEYEANWLTMLIQPYVQSLYDFAPGFLIEAGDQSSGKTMIAQLAAMVSNGVAGATSSWIQRDESELNRLIAGILDKGAATAIFDNVRGDLESGTLENLLTSRVFQARLVGGAGVKDMPNRTQWIFTSNNAQMNKDMAIRLVPIRIGKSDAARGRQPFKHPIMEYTRVNRDKIMGAILQIALEGLENRHLAPRAKQSFSKFQEWWDVMWPICYNIGLTEVLSTDLETRSRKVEDDAVLKMYEWALERFPDASWLSSGNILSALAEVHGSEGWVRLLPFWVAGSVKGEPTVDGYKTSRALARYLHQNHGMSQGGIVCRLRKRGRNQEFCFMLDSDE